MKEYTIILDPGHGGIDSVGKYTTAPSKMFKFVEQNVIAYEGQINREIAAKVGNYLLDCCEKVEYTVHPGDYRDISLSSRVRYANKFNPNTTIFVSIHSNSSPNHNASGFEIFTTKGKTKADKLATCIAEEIIKEFPDIRFRGDFSDGDIDKEMDFFVLKRSKCPAVLIENLFFDYWNDFILLRSETFQNRLSWRIALGIINYLNTVRK